MINKNLWVSIVICLVAVTLLAGTAMDLIPNTVSAADYSLEEEVEETQPLETVAQCTEVTALADQIMSAADTVESVPVEDPQDDPMWYAEMESAVLNKPKEQKEYFRYPLARRVYVSSWYGMRHDPVYGYYKMHWGIDLAGWHGDDVLAARSGTVIFAGYCPARGYYVQIDHGDGFVTEYFHLNWYTVWTGDRVETGDLIGYMGTTGYSTGTHLHFGMMYDGYYVNPADYIDFTYR